MGACRRAVGGALVTLAGRRRRTDAAGRAVLRVRPAHAAAYPARAARRGYAPGRAVVVAAAARFTG